MTTRRPITVEFYGIPRQRAGRSELAVHAGTVGELLTAVEQSCPQLTGLDRALKDFQEDAQAFAIKLGDPA